MCNACIFLQLVILPVRNHRYIITKNHLLCLKLTITCTSSRSFTWFFPACEHLLLLGIVRQIADELKELQSNEAHLNAAQHTEKIAGSLYNDFLVIFSTSFSTCMYKTYLF